MLRRLVRANKAALSLARQRHAALVGGKVDEVQVRHIRSTNARVLESLGAAECACVWQRLLAHVDVRLPTYRKHALLHALNVW